MTRTIPHHALLLPRDAKRVFEGVIFDVYHWEQTLFDGTTATFERLKRPDTVLVLAVKGDKIIFVREEQPGRTSYTGVAGGRAEEGEAWLSAAKRECKEELGLEFKQWRLINSYQPVSKIEWFVATYLAWDCESQGEVQHESGEKITIMEYSFEEAKRFATSLTDPTSLFIQKLFWNVASLDELLALPEFRGREV